MEDPEKAGAHRRTRDERGASTFEYALLAALIAIVAIAAMTFLGERTSGNLTRGGSAIESAR